MIDERSTLIKSLKEENDIQLIAKTYRNQIYSKNNKSIIKFFNNKIRCEQEIFALKLIKHDTLKHQN